MAGTILDRFFKIGVDVNGIIIPGRSISKVLSRHVFNLVVFNDDKIFKVSLVGSATAVRYRRREILLTTNHQIRGVDLSQVAMLTDSGSHIITSGGVRILKQRSDTDACDVAAFDFTEPCADRVDLRKRFFELSACPPDVVEADVAALLLSGYASQEQIYQLHENNHLGLMRRDVVCLPQPQPNDQALMAVRAIRPVDVDADGMSGGSAFVIQIQNGRPRAYFSGMIVRGGREYFYILKPGLIMAFLDAAFG